MSEGRGGKSGGKNRNYRGKKKANGPDGPKNGNPGGGATGGGKREPAVKSFKLMVRGLPIYSFNNKVFLDLVNRLQEQYCGIPIPVEVVEEIEEKEKEEDKSSDGNGEKEESGANDSDSNEKEASPVVDPKEVEKEGDGAATSNKKASPFPEKRLMNVEHVLMGEVSRLKGSTPSCGFLSVNGEEKAVEILSALSQCNVSEYLDKSEGMKPYLSLAPYGKALKRYKKADKLNNTYEKDPLFLEFSKKLDAPITKRESADKVFIVGNDGKTSASSANNFGKSALLEYLKTKKKGLLSGKSGRDAGKEKGKKSKEKRKGKDHSKEKDGKKGDRSEKGRDKHKKRKSKEGKGNKDGNDGKESVSTSSGGKNNKSKDRKDKKNEKSGNVGDGRGPPRILKREAPPEGDKSNNNNNNNNSSKEKDKGGRPRRGGKGGKEKQGNKEGGNKNTEKGKGASSDNWRKGGGGGGGGGNKES